MILQRVRMAGSLIFRRTLSLSLLPCVQGSREPCLLGYFLWRRVEPEYTGSWKRKSISSSQVQFRLQIFECWLFDELPLLQLMYRSQWKSLSYHLQVDKPRVFCVSFVLCPLWLPRQGLAWSARPFVLSDHGWGCGPYDGPVCGTGDCSLWNTEGSAGLPEIWYLWVHMPMRWQMDQMDGCLWPPFCSSADSNFM